MEDPPTFSELVRLQSLDLNFEDIERLTGEIARRLRMLCGTGTEPDPALITAVMTEVLDEEKARLRKMENIEIPDETFDEIKRALYFGTERLVRSGESPVVTDPWIEIHAELANPFAGFPKEKVGPRWKALYFGTERLEKLGESPMVTEALRTFMNTISVIHRDDLDNITAMEKGFSKKIKEMLPPKPK